MRNIGSKTLLLAITLLNISATPIPPPPKPYIVVIDPGHGGHDPGTRGERALEKDIALKISLRLGSLIENNMTGVKVIYTRKTDKYVALDERANMANKVKADLFICIHSNAIVGAKAYGTETYVMGLHVDDRNFQVAKRENSVILQDENYEQRYQGFDNSPESYILLQVGQSTYQENSLKFAQKVEQEFKTKGGRYSRGVKQAGFWVLWATAMPSVLIETGFLTYKQEESFLMSENGQETIAAGIYRAFKEYKSEIDSVN